MGTPDSLEEEARRYRERIDRLKAAPEERARRLADTDPFDYDAWVREAGPPDPDELREMEELLRERQTERAARLAQEVGTAA